MSLYKILYMKHLIFWITIICLSITYSHKWSFGIYFNGLNFHIKKPINPEHFHRALSKNKKLVYNGGIGFRIGYYLNKYGGITLTQAILPKDCANKMFIMSHVGVFISTSTILNTKHEIQLIGGPTIFIRQSWRSLKDYESDNLMKLTKNKLWEYKYIWYGGFMEYKYHYNKTNSFGFHVTPGIPEIISLSLQHTNHFQ